MRLSRRSVLLLALLLAALALTIEFTTRELVRPWTVVGPSMRPTLIAGDRILVDLWTYRYRLPVPGEILLLRGPPPAGEVLIKRCGTPPGPAASQPRAGVWPNMKTPREPGIWVLGDNYAESRDSRGFGAVPRSQVVGRVLYRYWPVESMGAIP